MRAIAPDLSVAELRERLRMPNDPERLRLLGKMLREARDIDVWEFTTPETVAAVLDLPQVRRRVGRQYGFWRFLIDGWRRLGLLSE